MRHEQLFDLIEVDQDRPIGAAKRLADGPLDGLVEAELAAGRAQLELGVQGVEQPGDGLLVGGPAVDRDVAKVEVAVELGDDGGLHDRRLAGAGGAEEGDAAVGEDRAGELVADRLAAVEAVAVARSVGLRPREGVDELAAWLGHGRAPRSASTRVSVGCCTTLKWPTPGRPAPRFSQISVSAWASLRIARLPCGGGR